MIEAAALQWDAHCFQILRFDDVVDGPTFVILGRGFRLAFDPEGLLVIAVHWKRAPDLGNGLDARERPDLIVDFTKRGANRSGEAPIIDGGRDRPTVITFED